MSLQPFVYIVDDDDAVRDSLALLLEAAGYRVRAFAAGRDFLEAAPTLAPGCLIADIRMPGMDGFELQKELTARRLNLPTIIITGHGDVPMAVRAMKAGAIDFVEKPFEEATILDSVGLAHRRLAEPSG